MNTRRRLGVLVKTFPKLSETFILQELLQLERAGFDLDIYALQRPTDALQQPGLQRLRATVTYVDVPAPSGLRVAFRHTVALLRSPLRYLRAVGHALGRREPRGWRDLTRALGLVDLIRQRPVSHLHAHFIDSSGSIAEVVAMLAPVTFSLSAHAKDIYLGDPQVIRRKLQRAAFTVTCTCFNHETLQAIAGNECRIHRVYHGIDTGRFALPLGTTAEVSTRRRPMILAVGRLRAKKGFATLLRACAHLKDSGRGFDVEIVGYGEEQPRLLALAQELGIADRVRLPGAMGHDGLLERYRAATVMAVPSEVAEDGDRDGLPNVLLEGMCMELPVVATRVSGIPEAIADGQNGLLVDAGDAVGLAAALDRLLSDRTLRSVLGRAARQTAVERFGLVANSEALHDLLSRFVTAQPGPSGNDDATVEDAACA